MLTPARDAPPTADAAAAAAEEEDDDEDDDDDDDDVCSMDSSAMTGLCRCLPPHVTAQSRPQKPRSQRQKPCQSQRPCAAQPRGHGGPQCAAGCNATSHTWLRLGLGLG